MNARTVWLLFVLTASLLAACDNHNDDPRYQDPVFPGGNVRLKTNIGLDMSTVVGFTLVPEGETAQGSPWKKSNTGDCMLSGSNGMPQGACTKLYALSTTGGIVPVELVDVVVTNNNEDQNDGGQGPTVPDTIYNVGKFVFFVFSGQLNTVAGACHMVVLQKSDGALYCSVDTVMTCPQVNDCMGLPSDKIVQANADGTLVHAFGSQQALLQLDFANPVSAVARTLFDPTDGRLAYFIGNTNGDVLSSINPSGTNSLDLRLYKRAGGFVNLPSFSNSNNGMGYCTYSGLGADSNSFYVVVPQQYHGGSVPAGLQNKIHRIGLAAGGVTVETYAEDTTSGLNFNSCTGNVSQASTLNRHFINWQHPNTSTPVENQFTEVYNPAGIPIRHTAADFKSIVRMYGCDSQIVLRGRDPDGNDLIARYYPDAATTAIVIKSLEYSITAVAVSDSCEITFGGRRASDNSRVLGTIPADSNAVNVVSNNLPGDVKALVRIR